MSEVFDNLLERAASRYRVLMNDDTIHVSNSPYWEQLRHAKDEYYRLIKARETLMKTGIYDISDEDYFSSHALNKSYLWKLIDQTPAHAQVKTQKTDSMAMGSAVHLAVLEPQHANKQIIQGPDTRRGKKWTDAVKEAEADGKITEEEVRSAMAKYMTWNYTTSEENTILRHNNQDYSKISKLVDYLQKGPF